MCRVQNLTDLDQFQRAEHLARARALSAGLALLMLQAISETIKKIAVMRGLIEDPHPFVSAHEAAELEGAALAAAVIELADKERSK